MTTLTQTAPLGTLGLPSGDHWVRFHVEGDQISYEVTASKPAETTKESLRKPTGFVQKWGGSVTKVADETDPWLAHLNQKHLR